MTCHALQLDAARHEDENRDDGGVRSADLHRDGVAEVRVGERRQGPVRHDGVAGVDGVASGVRPINLDAGGLGITLQLPALAGQVGVHEVLNLRGGAALRVDHGPAGPLAGRVVQDLLGHDKPAILEDPEQEQQAHAHDEGRFHQRQAAAPGLARVYHAEVLSWGVRQRFRKHASLQRDGR